MALSPRILVGGGTGYVGQHLSKMLKNRGYEVISVSRAAGIGRVTWTELSRTGLPENCAAVVNLSGELLMNPFRRWSEEFKSEIRASRIDKTRLLADLIRAADQKPKVFVSASAIGFYRPSLTAEYTEDSQGGDFDFFSTLCRDWEKSAALEPGLDVRQATVRIGLVMSRDGQLFKSMYLPFYLGLGGPIGSGKQWFPWIDADDVAGIFTHAIENDRVTGVLNAVAPGAVSNAEFTKTLASGMWRPAMFTVPQFAMNCLYGKERGSVVVQGQKVIPKRTVELGYKFMYPDIQSAVQHWLR